MTDARMRPKALFCLALSLHLWPACGFAAKPPASRSPLSLSDFARNAIGVGGPNRVAGSIAQWLDVAPDAPVHYLEVTAEQASDKMSHSFKVMVALPEGRAPEPIGVLLLTVLRKKGASESHWFRASLDGSLEKAFVIRGRIDAEGRGIKGSGTADNLDITSPDVQERFQHELDLWLKKAYLKKEWRSAEFSGGELKKRAKRP